MKKTFPVSLLLLTSSAGAKMHVSFEISISILIGTTQRHELPNYSNESSSLSLILRVTLLVRASLVTKNTNTHLPSKLIALHFTGETIADKEPYPSSIVDEHVRRHARGAHSPVFSSCSTEPFLSLASTLSSYRSYLQRDAGAIPVNRTTMLGNTTPVMVR